MPNVFFRNALKPVGFGEEIGEAAGPLVFVSASGDLPRVTIKCVCLILYSDMLSTCPTYLVAVSAELQHPSTMADFSSPPLWPWEISEWDPSENAN